MKLAGFCYAGRRTSRRAKPVCIGEGEMSILPISGAAAPSAPIEEIKKKHSQYFGF